MCSFYACTESAHRLWTVTRYSIAEHYACDGCYACDQWVIHLMVEFNYVESQGQHLIYKVISTT